jgi:mono/diheme cytochrome c family protein
VIRALVAAFAFGASLAPPAMVAAAEGSAASPQEDYVLNCSACHGLDGRGTPGVTPSLHGVGRFLSVPGGREYLVRVPGVAQTPLSDARVARLLGWALREYSRAEVDPPYTAEEIGELRRRPLRDPAAARNELVMQLDALSRGAGY